MERCYLHLRWYFFYEIQLFFLAHSDWEQICSDSGSLPVRRRQRGGAARQLLLHHARPSRQEGDQGGRQVAVRSEFLLVCYILGDRSGSARFWSMKTSQTMCMILLYYDLVIKKAYPLIYFLTNSQRNGWIYQSSALPVFLTSVQAWLVRKGTSMVGTP